MQYVKYISKYEVEVAPKNYKSMINFNQNVEAMRAAGFLPLIVAERPVDDTLYTVSYTKNPDSVEEVIITETPEQKAARKRKELDQLTLTPADVWRALYKAKQLRSSDLLALIEEKMTGVDMNLVEIEFGASLFYRGAQLGSGRLFDSIGALLGYTSDDMDYLFINKELPSEETEEETTEETEEE